jgi:glucokinase
LGELLVGVDVGGTKTAVVVSQDPSSVANRIEFPTQPSAGPEIAIRRIVDAIRSLVPSSAAIHAVGVSCGSPLDRITGVIQSPPNLPTWVNVPIRSILENEFHVPCRLENDANAGAVAEYRFGAGRGSSNMIFITMGTGFGAGLILDDRLYRGTTGAAGEIGHVRLTRTGPIGYGKPGSVEGWASGGGIAQLASSMLAAARRRSLSSVLTQHTGPLTARDLAAAAEQGDALARQILRAAGKSSAPRWQF